MIAKLTTYLVTTNDKVYRKHKSNPLSKMQSEFNNGLIEIVNNFKEHYNVKFLLKRFTSHLSPMPYLYDLPKI